MLTQLLLDRAHEPSAGAAAFYFRTYPAGAPAPHTSPRSFPELLRSAMAVARQLAADTRPGDRVLIATDTGLPYHLAFFGCLLAGVLPVPLPEPHTPGQLLRCRAAAADSGARCALVGGERAERTATALRAAGLGCVTLPIDPVPDEFVRARRPEYADIAYLQYTSGSTGTPRGVVVRDANLAANLQLICERLHMDAGDRLVSWLPPYHDMGLLAGVLLPLYCGGHALIMRTVDFGVQPLRWLRAIHEFRATFAVASNFAFDLCTARVPRDLRAELDLSSLRLLISGAEPVRARSVHAFLDAFASSGVSDRQFLPGYGLAEATLLVSMRDPATDPLRMLRVDRVALARGEVRVSEAAQAAVLVSCGRPGPGVHVRVVDPQHGTPLPERQVGEIWTQSASVCDGYWTERAPANLVHAGGERPWLRTGDLGFLHEGELYVSGRIKDVIIAHGVNHHAEDLEAAAEAAHPSLPAGRCVAFELEAEPRSRVVLALELGNAAADAAALCDAISAQLRHTHALIPDEIALLRRGALVRTTSGKLARAACRAAYARGELPLLHRWQRGEP